MRAGEPAARYWAGRWVARSSTVTIRTAFIARCWRSPASAAVRERLWPPVDRRAQGARRRRQRRALQSRDHLYGLFRRQDDRPHPAVRRVAAGAVGRGMAAPRNRHRPAHHRDQPVARRHLPRPARAGGRHRPGRSDPRQSATIGRRCAASTCRTKPMSTSAAPTSCATKRARFSSSKTTHAPLRGSATSSRTAT